MSRRPPKEPKEPKAPKSSKGSGAAAPRPRARFAKTQVGGGAKAPATLGKAEAAPPNDGDALLDQLFAAEGAPVVEEPPSRPKSSGRPRPPRHSKPSMASASVPNASPGAAEEEERETLLFHRALASAESGDEDAGDDDLLTQASSSWIQRTSDTAALDPSAFGAVSPPAPVVPEFAEVAMPTSVETTSPFAVGALPPDRGSTEELDLDDIELVGDVGDLFDPLAVGASVVPPSVRPTGGERASALEVPDAPHAKRPTTAPVDDDFDGLPTLFPPSSISDEDGTVALPRVAEQAADSALDFSQRGVYPRISIPVEALEPVVPAPVPSAPIALVPSLASPDEEFEILVDDLEYVDGPAPPSRSSLVSARQSVAGWLASSGPSDAYDDDVLVLSLPDDFGLPLTAEVAPVSAPVRDPLKLFVDQGAEAEAAVVGLIERGVRSEWVARAERMLAEAPTGNAALRANTLLVVSELFAMAGEHDRAEGVATEALTLAPASPMHQRQLRGILATKRAWPKVVEQLGRELRTAPSGSARAHAGFLASEVSRAALGDHENAARMLDRAMAADPEDVRGPLARWVLAAGDKDAALEVPQGAFSDVFKSVASELAALRSNGAEGADVASPFGRLLVARAGLRRRDAKTAVSLLLEIAALPELSGAAAWLAAVLGGPYADLADRVDHALRLAGAGSHRERAQRALVAHALERGDVGTVAAAIRGSDALAPVDRLLLAAILGSRTDLPEPDRLLLDALDGSHDVRPLVTAAAAALGAAMPIGDASGHAHGRVRAALARALAATRRGFSHDDALAYLAPILETLLEQEPEDGSGRAWDLERRLAEGELARLVEAIPGGSPEQRTLAAGLAAELSGAMTRPAGLEALAQTNDAALRMLVAHAQPAAAASALESRAASVDGRAAALLLTEAACRLPFDVARADALWIRAHDQDPEWPVAPLFAFASALRTSDGSKARHWLARCNLEPLHEHVLTGLRLAAKGSDERREALAAAHRLDPTDVVLREQLELAGGGTADRARWLEDTFEARGGREPELALEASLLYELDGDLESAARCVSEAHLAGSVFGDVVARRLARAGYGARAAIERIESSLLRAESPRDKAALHVEAARIAWHGVRDREDAARRFREAVEAGLGDVATLSEAEQRAFEVVDFEALARIELALAKTGSDCVHGAAHAMLAVRAATRAGEPLLAFEAVQLAAQQTRRGAWSLRKVMALAPLRRDVNAVALAAADLAARATNPLERAALLCRAAEASLAAGDHTAASASLMAVFKAWPRHPIARLLRATLLERSGALVEAAVAFEELAGMSRSRKDRAQRCFKAATLWLASNDARASAEGRRLLEAACELDPENASAFERLQAIYLAGGARMELAELLSQRVRGVADPRERGALEGLRGRMLAEAGASAEAKAALAASLKVRPDDVDAWRAYADVALAEEDGEAAEHALLQLGRLVSEPAARAEVFLKLGDVYARLRPNHDRAARAYREAEKLAPARIEVRERLIELQAARGDRVGALAAQRELCERATTAGDRVARLVSLSWLEERLGDLAEAEKILVELRRHHPTAAPPVKALHAYYLRHGKRALADTLLERVPQEVTRHLLAGRTEEGLFDTAVVLAELRGRSDGVAVARAIRSSAHGGAARLGGAGARGAHPSLDDVVAPEAFSAELRELLAATGHVLEAAVPFEAIGLRTRPLTQHDAHVARAKEIASSHGIAGLELVVASTLSATIVPVSTVPVVLCVGAPLLDPSNLALFDLCLHRALTLVRTRTAALARVAPIDEWAVLAAYLRLHDPELAIDGVDGGRLEELGARMRAHAAGVRVEPQHVELARKAYAALGSRGLAVGASAVAWSWHVATLCVGDLALVFDAMAFATSAVGAPVGEAERLRWVGKHLEARELLGFLLGTRYLEARARLGLLVPP